MRLSVHWITLGVRQNGAGCLPEQKGIVLGPSM